MPPWEILTSGKVKIEIDPSMADREELWLDLGCGTATGATLYALLFYPKARVICYDRDKTSEYVKGFLPPSVRHWVKVITGDDGDVGKLTIEKLETEVRRFKGLPLSRVTHGHWSPSCEGISDVSRGHHRDAHGRPRTAQAAEEDVIFEHGCQLMRALARIAQSCQITIENPVSQHFPHQPGVRMLLRDPQ